MFDHTHRTDDRDRWHAPRFRTFVAAPNALLARRESLEAADGVAGLAGVRARVAWDRTLEGTCHAHPTLARSTSMTLLSSPPDTRSSTIHADHGPERPIRRDPDPARRGSALAMALVLVSSATLISVLALQRGLTQWKNQAASSANKHAFYMAEAGLAEAIDALRHGSSGNVGTRTTPAAFGDGAFWVEAVTDADGVISLTSTGLSNGSAYRLSQSVHFPRLPLASQGIFGALDVAVGDGAEIRFADPSAPGGGGGTGIDPVDDVLDGAGDLLDGLGGVLGGGVGNGNGNDTGNGNGKDKDRILLPVAIAPQAPAQPLLGSDGTITLGLGSLVDGLLTPGPDGLVSNLLGALIDGGTTPAPDARPLPQIAMPIVAEPLVPVFTGGELLLEDQAFGYEAITVAAGQTLRLVGPVSLVTPSLVVEAGGALIADTTGGEVHLFVDTCLAVADGASALNTTGDPARFVVLVDGRAGLDLDADGANDGAVVWHDADPVALALYAPHAAVALPDGITWTGSIVAQSIDVGDGAVVELDERVLDVEMAGRDLERLAWRTLPIPPAERAALGVDPLATVVSANGVLPKADAARVPATNAFRFTSPEGDLLTYVGNALGDLTTATVDAVLPAAVKPADAAPAFAATEKDGADKGVGNDPVARAFKFAWIDAERALPADWIAALEAGKVPTVAWDAVVIDGVPVEPIHSVFGDPALRGDIDAYLESSDHQDTTITFLRAALDLMP